MNRGKQLTRELESEEQMSDRIIGEIVAALDEKDVEKLKTMFSESALVEFDEWGKMEGIEDDKVPDLYEQIAGVMEFYQGMMVSYEMSSSASSAGNHDGNAILTLRGHYIVETDKETYHVRFQYRPIDDENSKAIGLSRLEIVTKENYDRDEFEWQLYTKGHGVYWQEYNNCDFSCKLYGKGPDADWIEKDW